jgi:hypothetical protein
MFRSAYSNFQSRRPLVQGTTASLYQRTLVNNTRVQAAAERHMHHTVASNHA